MLQKFADRTISVLVLEPNDTRRMQISQTLKTCLLKNVTNAKTVQDAFDIFASDEAPPDWIVTSVMSGEAVNAFHLLTLCIKDKRFRGTKVSLLLKDGEHELLGNAFEMGLLSCHRLEGTGAEMAEEFRGFFATGTKWKWEGAHIAAHYLRRHLTSEKRADETMELERNLQSAYPDEPQLFMQYALAQHMTGKTGQALITLKRVKALAPELRDEVTELAAKLASATSDVSLDETKTSIAEQFGIDSCVIVDSDDAVRAQLEKILAGFGATFIRTFADGQSAWNWMSENPEPDLVIVEWRIPKISGNILIQRIRSHGFVKVPIIVYSSLVKAKDGVLLQEMGVTDLMEKPLPNQLLQATLKGILEKEQVPDARTMARRIRHLLQGKLFAEAKAMADELFAKLPPADGTRKAIEAEFAFHEGKLRTAKDLALSALQLSGESLPLLSLLAKILTKVQEFDLALKFLNRAESLSPQNIERLCSLAEVRCEVGDLEGADNAIASAKRLDKNNEMVLEAESKVAISRGDTERARELLKDRQTLSGVVAFLNNRAASLARQGEFDEAMQLYQNALKAIPKDQGRVRSIVLYNMGLGYARHQDLASAAAKLKEATVRPDSPVHAKAASLVKRVETALQTGKPLVLQTGSDAESGGAAMDEYVSVGEETAIPMASDIRRGDLCLHLIYQASYGLNPAVAKLLANMPSIGVRRAISWSGKSRAG